MKNYKKLFARAFIFAGSVGLLGFKTIDTDFESEEQQLNQTYFVQQKPNVRFKAIAEFQNEDSNYDIFGRVDLKTGSIKLEAIAEFQNEDSNYDIFGYVDLKTGFIKLEAIAEFQNDDSNYYISGNFPINGFDSYKK